MEYALLALKGPSNIEKNVRELQSTLYRHAGLTSSLALPVMIPLCFVAPNLIPTKRAELRDRLRRAVGKVAPNLRSRTVSESDGFLFWDLSPRRELQRLWSSCQEVFAPAFDDQADQQEFRHPDLFPVARGFFLCSLEGQPLDRAFSLPVPESLLFPAKATMLLRFHPLDSDSGTTQAADDPEDRPWWKSLFWEKLEEIPLRKAGVTD
jgi:hypothetical protein